MLFKDNYFFLSNFYSEKPLLIDINGEKMIFSSAEAAFWAQKDPSKARYFRLLKPLEAKNYAKDYVKETEDWGLRQILVMANVLHVKFQDKELMDKLINVKEKIVHDNFWKDTFWGVYKDKGLNILGQLLECIKETSNSWEKLLILVKNIITSIDNN